MHENIGENVKICYQLRVSKGYRVLPYVSFSRCQQRKKLSYKGAINCLKYRELSTKHFKRWYLYNLTKIKNNKKPFDNSRYREIYQIRKGSKFAILYTD